VVSLQFTAGPVTLLIIVPYLTVTVLHKMSTSNLPLSLPLLLSVRLVPPKLPQRTIGYCWWDFYRLDACPVNQPTVSI